MNDKPEEKGGELLVCELCLQGDESGESCSNTRGSGPAEKSISRRIFSNGIADSRVFTFQKANAQAMFCVLEKLKKTATALSSLSYFFLFLLFL